MSNRLMQEWCREFSPTLVTVTGLLVDLVRMVGQFAVPLEHMWMPVPKYFHYHRDGADYFYNGPCYCKHDNDRTFVSCMGWKHQYQHTGSIYTIGESGATGWRIHFSRIKTTMPTTTTTGYVARTLSTCRIRWWMGVIWGNIQEIKGGFSGDSLYSDPNMQAITLTHFGTWYFWNGVRGQEIEDPTNTMTDCDKSDYIEVYIDLPSTLTIRTNQGKSTSICREWPRPLQNGCPFVQFARETDTTTATIQTLF